MEPASAKPSQQSKQEDVRLKLNQHTNFEIEIADNTDFDPSKGLLTIDKLHEELEEVKYNCSFVLHRKACWLNVRQGYSGANGANNIGVTCKVSFQDFTIIKCSVELDKAGVETDVFVIWIRLKKDKHFLVEHAGQGVFQDAKKPIYYRHLAVLPLYNSRQFVESRATDLRMRLFGWKRNTLVEIDHIEKVLNSFFIDNAKQSLTDFAQLQRHAHEEDSLAAEL